MQSMSATDTSSATAGGIRARARREMINEIKSVAWNHIGRDGVPSLSLRAISREMEMTSSALYRYFPNRTALLTALIIDAFNELASTVETAVEEQDPGDFSGRYVAFGMAVHGWAVENPHRFALVYGTPLPDYEAPDDTIMPGVRTQMVLYRLLLEWGEQVQEPVNFATRPVPAALVKNLEEMVAEASMDATAEQVLAAIVLWAETLGLIYGDLFNHFGDAFVESGLAVEWALAQKAETLFGASRP